MTLERATQFEFAEPIEKYNIIWKSGKSALLLMSMA